jgi:hypothetical protein
MFMLWKESPRRENFCAPSFLSLGSLGKSTIQHENELGALRPGVFFFFSSFFWCGWIGDHLYKKSTKFGYEQDMKVKKV